MISQTILGRYTSIEYRMKYRVSYDTILYPISRVYAVGIAQMPSVNTPTIRVGAEIYTSINAIMRVSA